MRAAVSISASQPLQLQELPSRPLRAGEVRVQTGAIGVNPVDWKMREAGPLYFAYQLLGPGGGFIPGIDFAGTVREVGPGVTELAVGDRVVGGTDFSRKQHGSYADEIIARPDQCAKLPPEVSFEVAACLPVASVTAWMALREKTDIGPGKRVLVLGAAGGVGLSTLQLGKMLGAHCVGVCSTKNVPLVEAEGAVAIDYTQGDALEAAKAHGPYDLVLQLVGTDVYPLGKCRALLAPGGRVELVVIRPADYLSLVLPSVGTLLGAPNRARLTPLVAAVARGDLRPKIERTFPLAEAEKAHEVSKAGKVVGKLLLVP
jgi:NADPH:quinone reductase-like Zn-dependent oxidoreductase